MTREELQDACRKMQASPASRIFKSLYALDVQAEIARNSLEEAKEALLKSGARTRSVPLSCGGEK